MTEDNATPTPESTESPNWKQVRDKLDRLEAENARLRNEALEGKALGIGLDPSKGVVKLALKEFVAQEDQSVDALKTFAADLGLIESDGAGSTNEETGAVPPSQEDVQRQQDMQTLQNRASTLRGFAAEPEGVQDVADQIGQAEQAGDWTKAITLKLDQARGTYDGP